MLQQIGRLGYFRQRLKCPSMPEVDKAAPSLHPLGNGLSKPTGEGVEDKGDASIWVKVTSAPSPSSYQREKLNACFKCRNCGKVELHLDLRSEERAAVHA